MALRLAHVVHPGEILRDDFLLPLGLSAGQLAKALGLPRTRIERIVREEVGISTDTALRLGRYFDTSPELWLNLQRAYDLEIEGESKKEEIARIVPRSATLGSDREASAGSQQSLRPSKAPRTRSDAAE